MTENPKISSDETYALVVGIEKYQQGDDWNLDGPASDAIKFAEWLLAKKVKKENIYLFISPSDNNQNLLENFKEKTKLTSQPANRENITNAIDRLLKEDVSGQLLYVFWGGHGSITKSEDTKRLLWFSDTDYTNCKSLDFFSLLEALKNSPIGFGFSQQVYLLDTCASRLYEQDVHLPTINWIKKSSQSGSSSSQSGNHAQFVLFASAEYEVAENKRGGGIFSQAVMEELKKLPDDCLLPDMEELNKTVDIKLEAEGKPKPVYKRFWNGSEEVFDRPPLKIDWHKVCCEILAEQRQNITTNTLKLSEGETRRVEDVYVGLGLVERKKQSKREHDVEPEKGSDLYKEIEITKTFEYDAFIEEVIKQKNTPIIQGKHIAIIGEPGAGKTTLLQQIGNWISQNIEHSVVIWVSLAYLEGRELEETYLFKTWLTAAVRRQGKGEATEQMKDNFTAQFKQGRVWLLLDGLDEMSISSANPLRDIGQQIKDGGSISQARIVLTCRVNLWDASSNVSDDFDIYRTLNFSYPEQVKQFIDKWFTANREKRDGLHTALQEPGKERIQDLVKNPLRLTLLCLIWQFTEGNLPDTQAGLYQQFVNNFDTWKKDELNAELEQIEQLKLKLGELAKEAIKQEATRFRLRTDFVSQLLGKADNKKSLLNLALNRGWLNNVGIDTDGQTVYAFFHASFQEYFAATAIPHWHFFLKYNPNNPTKGTYRIFEPQWRQTILLWLGRREENLKQQKQEFINALVNFQDGCGNWERENVDKGFYEYQSYFLAAAGIAEFKDCSQADEIVAQIVKWGFGYSPEKQKWVKFIKPIEDTAQLALQRTERTKAIAVLVQLLKFPNLDDDTYKLVVKSLGRIGTGNEKAIAALVAVLQSTTVDDFTRRLATENLGKIGTGNEFAIAALEELLQSTTVDDFTRKLAAKSLETIHPAALEELWQSTDVSNDKRWAAAKMPGTSETFNKVYDRIMGTVSSAALDQHFRMMAAGSLGTSDPAALVELLQSTDKYKLWAVAERLGTIGTGNEFVIAALVELLQSTTVDDFTRRLAAESLVKIGTDNEFAIATLVGVLQSTTVDDKTRSQVAESLGTIHPGNEFAIATLVEQLQSTTVDDKTRIQAAESLGKVVQDNKDRSLAVKGLKDYLQFDNNYNLIWKCSQNMAYPDFYQTWHQGKNDEEVGVNQPNLLQCLQAAIDNDAQLSQSIHLICIDTSKFIDPDNPASKIYTKLVRSGCPKCEDGTPKTMADFQSYWELLDTDKCVVLVFHSGSTNTTGGVTYSDVFLNAISKFDGAICFISDSVLTYNTLKVFAPSQSIDEILEWLREGR